MNLSLAEQEACVIGMEECGELTQAISKVVRFGPEEKYADGTVNATKLAEEIADIEIMIGVLYQMGLVSRTEIEFAKSRKIERAWKDIGSGERKRFKHLPLGAFPKSS